MTLAAETREAVRANPFLYDALRAGVVNYSAAARYLEVDGETETVVAALRRYATDMPDRKQAERGGAVSMQRGLGPGEPGEALLVVGDVSLVTEAGSLTALTAPTGDVHLLERALGRLRTGEVTVEAAAVAGESLVVVVGGRDGPDALRAVEDVLDS